ncbi:MAG: tRNA lysidine(34) synthetase TilS [Jatrophihabitantaceae bacterium]
MGPAPAVAAVRSALRHALAGLPVTRPVLVACSGGADSTALAAALAFEAARTGRPAGLVTIDHDLQAGSAERASQVAGFGYELGLDPVYLFRVTVGRRGGPEAAARTARYAALDGLIGDPAGAGPSILLGHTADDQAETVLLGLGRGSGARSIAGMRPVAGGYLRPLLGLRRADTEAACAALGLPVWQDPHNQDRRFQRVRLRQEVLPLLEDVLQGGVSAALARTAALLADDLDALELLADRLLAEASGATGAGEAAGASGAGGLAVAALAGQPRALVTRVLKRWAEGSGTGALAAGQVGELARLVFDWHGQAGVDLPGGVRAVRVRGRLAIEPTPKPVSEPAPRAVR